MRGRDEGGAGRVDYRVVGGSLDPEFLPLPTSGPLLPGVYKFTGIRIW